MKARYVVDTNVLIAASATNPNSRAAREATPEDPELRQKVHNWLTEFDASTSRMVLDSESKIYDEYCNNLGFNDYGIQVIIHKYSQCACDTVEVLYDENGYGYLNEPLASVIHDWSDKKMVAAGLETIKCHGECAIANAGDTDWYDWEKVLLAVDLEVEQIIPEWSRKKWKEKKRRV